MDIQEESPLPSSLLEGLEDDYQHAVLHLAWDWNKKADEQTLLFAFVELLPAEIPPPIDDYDYKAPRCSHPLGKGSSHYVYVRHAVASARQAINWYLAARGGVAVLPDDDGTIRAPDDPAALFLKLASLGEEPVWPTLISASDDSETLPFVPQWIRFPRTHHLLPLAEVNLDQLWSEQEREEAQRWLEGRLHYDLREYPEYWGSLHLIAPNPVYRELHSRLQPRVPPAESVLLRFEPRAGKSVAGLELIFHERDPWGVTASLRRAARGPLIRVNFDRAVNSVTEDVWDPRRGLLESSSEATPFLSSIELDMGIAQTTVVKAQGETFEVMRSGEPEKIIVGEPHKVAAARSRVIDAYYKRQQRRTAEDHDQRWFRDQKKEARDLVRSKLNEANNNVLLIDPYFGASELGELLAVGRDDIPIHVLSSTKGLKEHVSKESELEKGEQLADALQKLQTQSRVNPLEVRVMTGDNPAIHDRFLLVDNRIWLFGSSLHSFGLRGTMILGLPDPDAVRDELLKAWNESEPLMAWVEQRRKSRNASGGEGT